MPLPQPPPLASQALRSRAAPLLLLPSSVLTGVAYAVNGNPTLTNFGFAWMAVCCLCFISMELWNLRTRQGWGALALYGGVLVWFCIDYFTHWWDPQWILFPSNIIPTIAKMAFLHCLFVTLMAWGMTLRIPDRVIHLLRRYPEPKNLDFLCWFAVATLAGNLTYIALFSYGSMYNTIYASFFGGRLGQIGSSAGFSGNLNNNMFAYLSFFAGYVGVGALAAIAYIVMAPPAYFKKTLAFVVFGYALMTAYGSGTRTAVVGTVLPAVFFLLLRGIQTRTLRKSWKWIAIVGFIGLGMTQIQTFFRSDYRTGLDVTRIDFSDQRLTGEVAGNTMFSEALDAYFEIPDHRPFFHNGYLGEGAIRAIPQMAFWFGIGPIPRPLWKDKPVDPAWAYRAEDASGAAGGAANQGTTISYGVVGAWYFRFGLAGVIEGAILMGWLYAMAERMLRDASTRHSFMQLCIGLFMLSTLFFFYRDLVFFGVWPVIMLLGLMYFIIKYFYPQEN